MLNFRKMRLLNSFSYSTGPQPSYASYVVPMSHPTLLTFIIFFKKGEKKKTLFYSVIGNFEVIDNFVLTKGLSSIDDA